MWATAGVASLVGPLAGGVLVDGLGWQWILFVNVPIGVVGLGLAVWLVAVRPTEAHRLGLVGGLSGVGMVLLVLRLQEGQPPIGSRGSGMVAGLGLCGRS